MEDSKKEPRQPKGNPPSADEVIELTPELEVMSTSRSKIIDLTQVLSFPGAPANPVSPPKPIVSRTASAFTAKVSRQKGPESDVDATFDLIQSRAEQLRAPRVEPAPRAEDLKVPAPAPIGDWDASVAETLPPKKEPVAEKPADPGLSPMNTAVSEALELIGDGKAAADAPKDETMLEPAEEAPAPETAPPPIPDEAPASLLETAIELDEDEEIIDLDDIVSTEELAAALAAEGGEEEPIIELNEIVSAEELAAAGLTPASPEREEDILELSDVVSGQELAAAGYAPPAAAAATEEQAEGEEEIIELVDRVELPLPEETAAMASELVRNPPETLSELEPEAAAPADLDDKDSERMTMEVFAGAPAPTAPAPQVIQLDNVLDHVRKNREPVSEGITLGITEELAREKMPDGGEFPIGIPVDEVKEVLGSGKAPGEAEIEAAIEKVIRSKYGQTIEQMIAAVVERVVTREMDNIKRDLLEDQGDSEDL